MTMCGSYLWYDDVVVGCADNNIMVTLSGSAEYVLCLTVFFDQSSCNKKIKLQELQIYGSGLGTQVESVLRAWMCGTSM